MKINYFKQLGAYLGILLLTTYCGPTQPEMDDESRLTAEEIRANEQVSIKANLIEEGESSLQLLSINEDREIKLNISGCASGHEEEDVYVETDNALSFYKGDKNCVLTVKSIGISWAGEVIELTHSGLTVNNTGDFTGTHSTSSASVSAEVEFSSSVSSPLQDSDAITLKYRMITQEDGNLDIAAMSVLDTPDYAFDSDSVKAPEFSLTINDMTSGAGVGDSGEALLNITLDCNSSTDSAEACGDVEGDGSDLKWLLIRQDDIADISDYDELDGESYSAFSSYVHNASFDQQMSNSDYQIDEDVTDGEAYYIILQLAGDTAEDGSVHKSYAVYKFDWGDGSYSSASDANDGSNTASY